MIPRSLAELRQSLYWFWQDPVNRWTVYITTISLSYTILTRG